MELEYADARVARGMALLDDKLPGWRDLIDLNDLRISSGHYCVLGQLYTQQYYADDQGAANPFVLGLLDLAQMAGIEAYLSGAFVEGVGTFDVEHGFMEDGMYDPSDIDDDEEYDDNEALTAAWVRALTKETA